MTLEFAEPREANLRSGLERLRSSAPAFGEAMTSADAPTGERWDRGQVLSHLAEMIPFWLDQMEKVAAGDGAAVPFGRVKTTPDRLERIEAGRHAPLEQSLADIDAGVERAVTLMQRFTDAELARIGAHPARGEMTVSQGLDHFVIEHFEEHVDQLAAPDRARWEGPGRF